MPPSPHRQQQIGNSWTHVAWSSSWALALVLLDNGSGEEDTDAAAIGHE